jgi:hypothetical protein
MKLLYPTKKVVATNFAPFTATITADYEEIGMKPCTVNAVIKERGDKIYYFLVSVHLENEVFEFKTPTVLVPDDFDIKNIPSAGQKPSKIPRQLSLVRCIAPHSQNTDQLIFMGIIPNKPNHCMIYDIGHKTMVMGKTEYFEEV